MTDTNTTRWEQLNQTGCRYLGQGDFAHADETFRSALAEAEQFGADSLHLATTLNNFGQLKYRQREFEQASDLFRRSLAIRERMLGADHALVLQSINNLSALHVANGDLDQAEPLLDRALTLSQNRLEAAQSDVAVNLNNLARLYFKRNDYQRAEPLLLRLLALKRGLGRDHPEVAAVLASLAKLRHTLGNFDGAERLWRRVLMIREQAAEPNDAAIATALENLADSASAQGKDDESLSLRERALRLREQALGADHPSLGAARAKVAEMRARRTPRGTAAAEPRAAAWPSGDHERIEGVASHPPATGRPSTKMPLPKIGDEPAAPATENASAPPQDETVWWSPDASPDALFRRASGAMEKPAALPPEHAVPLSGELAPPPAPRRSSPVLSHAIAPEPASHHAPMREVGVDDYEPRRRAPQIGFHSHSESWGKKAGIAAGVIAALALAVWLIMGRGDDGKGESVDTGIPAVEAAAPPPPVQQQQPTTLIASDPALVTPPAPVSSPPPAPAPQPERRSAASPPAGSSRPATARPDAAESLMPQVNVGNFGLDGVTRAIDDSSRAKVEAATKVETRAPSFKPPRER